MERTGADAHRVIGYLEATKRDLFPHWSGDACSYADAAWVVEQMAKDDEATRKADRQRDIAPPERTRAVVSVIADHRAGA